MNWSDKWGTTTNLSSFDDEVTHLAEQGKSANVILLDFIKAFTTVSHSLLLDKLPSIELDKHVMQGVSNGLMGRAQRVIVNGLHRAGGQSLVGLHRDPSWLWYSVISW